MPDGKYTGPVKFVFSGDVEKARSLSGYARTQIGNAVSASSASSAWLNKTLPDGSIVKVNTQGAHPIAHIFSPSGGGKVRNPIDYIWSFMPTEYDKEHPYPGVPAAPANHVWRSLLLNRDKETLTVYGMADYAPQFPGVRGTLAEDPDTTKGIFSSTSDWRGLSGETLQWPSIAGKYRNRQFSASNGMTLRCGGYEIAHFEDGNLISHAFIYSGHVVIVTRKVREAPLTRQWFAGIYGVSSTSVADVTVWAAPFAYHPGHPYVTLTNVLEQIGTFDVSPYERQSNIGFQLEAIDNQGAPAFVSYGAGMDSVAKADGSRATIILAGMELYYLGPVGGYIPGSPAYTGDPAYDPMRIKYTQLDIIMSISDGTVSCSFETTPLPHKGLLMDFVPRVVSGTTKYVTEPVLVEDDADAQAILAYDYVGDTLRFVTARHGRTNDTGNDFKLYTVVKYRAAEWHSRSGHPDTTWRTKHVVGMDLRYETFMFILTDATGSYITVEQYTGDDTSGNMVEVYRLQLYDTPQPPFPRGNYQWGTRELGNPVYTFPYSPYFGRPGEYDANAFDGGWANASRGELLFSVRDRNEFIFQFTPINCINVFGTANQQQKHVFSRYVRLTRTPDGISAQAYSFDKLLKRKEWDAEEHSQETYVINLGIIRDKSKE